VADKFDMDSIAEAMTANRDLELKRLGPMEFDAVFETVRGLTVPLIEGGEESPPYLVLRLDDGSYYPIKLNHFEPGRRGDIIFQTMMGYYEVEKGRPVGAAVVSEAYFRVQHIDEEIDRDALGSGKLESREVLLLVLFDGLTGSLQMHTAPIDRSDEKIALEDWASAYSGADLRMGGDLAEGLAQGLLFVQIRHFGADLGAAQGLNFKQ